MEPRVVLADNAGLFALGGTQTFLIGRAQVAIVDPGPGSRAHLERVVAEVAGAREGVILLTHEHSDHSGGAAALAERTGFPIAGAGSLAEIRLADGSRIPTDAGELQVTETPGHARDHLVFLEPESGDLFAGDLFIGEGNTTWVGEYPGCVADYLVSLDRVAELGARRILPAHGPALEDSGEAIARFRRHRLARIEQVAEAVRGAPEMLPPRGVAADAGAWDRAAARLVERIYGGALPPGLQVGARWSVRAMLEYLELAPFPLMGAPTEGGTLGG